MGTGDAELKARIGLGAAGFGLVIGALLPWVTGHVTDTLYGPRHFSINGFDPERPWGLITLLIGVFVLGFALSAPSRRRAKITGLAGLVALALMIDNWSTTHGGRLRLSAHQIVVWHRSVGIGLWLTGIAALAVIGCSIWIYRIEQARAEVATPAGAPS